MKNKNILVSVFLLVVLALVFIGCDTGSNSTGSTGGDDSSGSVDLSKISIDDIPSLEDLGLDGITADDLEDLESFEAPTGWTLVNSWEQIPGTWVMVEEGNEEDDDEGIGWIIKSSVKITADKVVSKVEMNYSAVEDIDQLWDDFKENKKNYPSVNFDDKNYIITYSVEALPVDMPFDGIMGDVCLLSADKKILASLSLGENGKLLERVFIKAN